MNTPNTQNQPQTLQQPGWLVGKRINEVAFCREFLQEHPLACVNGSFFNEDGLIDDADRLRRLIYDRLSRFVFTGLTGKTETLLSLLRTEAYLPELPLREDRIHVANGTLFLDGAFSERRELCRNRLPVRWEREGRLPQRWLAFLGELLEQEDVCTLQEFMGYCLLPTNRAQRMLMIIGQGGEGKSRIGAAMRALFGSSMVNGNLAKIETNRFARADLEHRLVMVDDDMQLEALPQTNYLKSIITAEQPMDLERKGAQSYQGELYCRFLGFGNGSIRALYDRTDGFFRRQIILRTRQKDPNRVDDPYLSEKIAAEKDGLLLWSFQGLQRLVGNGFRFTVSRRSRETLAEQIREAHNPLEFLRSEGYVRLTPDGQTSSRRLCAAYRRWCSDNELHALSSHSFVQQLLENQERCGLRYTNTIRESGGKRVRGFFGVETFPDAAEL